MDKDFQEYKGGIYMRPETLFSNKFDSYLNESLRKKSFEEGFY